ncbi:MAG: hypothetical protein GYA36_05080 [Veillonellaceae bacterium]|nr:hypothetical protein [Veillonellaceae bacterium]
MSQVEEHEYVVHLWKKDKKWVFVAGIYVVNPEYEEEFRHEHPGSHRIILPDEIFR